MLPFVSVITPTKNRPQFFKNILRNFIRQDYADNNMELIIGDDSDISYEGIIPNVDNIKYFHTEKMPIGKKRNYLIEKSKGDIIVFMDDDDYYPNDKVSYIVDNLWKSKYLVSGSSIMHVYYIAYDKIYKYGPYGKYHATCGTMSFKREYFERNKFVESAEKAEERLFLKKWKTPVLQLNSLKSILCIAHMSNTVDKHRFIKKIYETELKLEDIVDSESDLQFFKEKINIQAENN